MIKKFVICSLMVLICNGITLSKDTIESLDHTPYYPDGYYFQKIPPTVLSQGTHTVLCLNDTCNVKIVILDEDDNIVKLIFEGVLPKDKYRVEWDRRDNNEELVKDGRYYMYVETFYKRNGFFCEIRFSAKNLIPLGPPPPIDEK